MRQWHEGLTPTVRKKEALKGKGVDEMAGVFPNAKPVPGVTDNGDAQPVQFRRSE
jgi:hypothetical protein